MKAGTTHPEKPAPVTGDRPKTATTTAVSRMGALARVELILLLRGKGTLFAALVVPLVLPFSFRGAAKGLDLSGTGLTLGTVLLPGALGLSLLFAVYSSLVGIFVARREELVLKRLRTGELHDREILLGAALPAIGIGLAQSVVLVAGFGLLIGVEAPKAVYLVVLGILFGLLLSVTLAALSATVSRTAESAALTAMPMLILTMIGSGVAVPLDVFPDALAHVCRVLPLTPVITLLRGGWAGNLGTGETLVALGSALAWSVLTVLAVRKWFRWEPRR
ncbi:ABC transporter permease [Streptomyces sp. NPDC007088]|uniref:ABC transporter permease n=1 Tax=Streptomyces sp. NPDC007088 TaxID=3364773 RepID=UPI00369DD54D